MSIQFLKQTTHDALYSDIKNNLERYKVGDFEDLITPDRCLISDKVTIDFDELSFISGNDKNDAKNALSLDKALDGLSPHVARDKRLWTYLTHTHLLKYTRERYPFPDESLGQDRSVRHIIHHFFANSARDFERDNAVSRLWWTAFMCKRASHLDLEKALKSIFLYQDPIVQLLGRPTTVISTNIFNSILEKMVNSMEGDKAFLKERYKYNRPFLTELSSLGGHNLLDALTPEESREAMQLIDEKILESTNSESEKEVPDYDAFSTKKDNNHSMSTPKYEGDSISNVIEDKDKDKDKDNDDVVVIPKEDQSLRDKLVEFNINVISKKFPNTDIHERIMSPVMIMSWLAYKPRNHEEFLEKFRESDRQGIAEDERVYIDDICEIIDNHA